MKKTITLILLLFISNLTYADSSPSETIFNYYKALNNSEYKKGYGYISNERKEAITEEEFVNHHEKSPYKEVYAQLIEYKLIKEKVSNKTAIVKLTLKTPSFSVVMPILMSASHLAINALEGKEELSKFLKKQLEELKKRETIPYEKREISVNMIKENGEWKLAK